MGLKSFRAACFHTNITLLVNILLEKINVLRSIKDIDRCVLLML